MQEYKGGGIQGQILVKLEMCSAISPPLKVGDLKIVPVNLYGKLVLY